MKLIKKFSSFNELKSDSTENTDYALSLKRHKEFEKLIEEIRKGKVISNSSINKHSN